jgi:hypothetical protein
LLKKGWGFDIGLDKGLKESIIASKIFLEQGGLWGEFERGREVGTGLNKGLEDSGYIHRISIKRGGVFRAITDIINSIVKELLNTLIRVLFQGY